MCSGDLTSYALLNSLVLR